MANSRTSGVQLEKVTIDTNPSAGGYWTEPVSMRRLGHDLDKIFFSVREADSDWSDASVATPILQFRCPGDDGWTDYNNDATDFIIGDHKIIEGNAGGVEWRAGVKEDGFTSGSVVIGFNW